MKDLSKEELRDTLKSMEKRYFEKYGKCFWESLAGKHNSIADDAVNPKHYTSMKISPLEYITENNMGWCEGNVIKYVSRYKMKNGLECLKKAKWYLDYLISIEEKKDDMPTQ